MLVGALWLPLWWHLASEGVVAGVLVWGIVLFLPIDIASHCSDIFFAVQVVHLLLCMLEFFKV